VIASYRSLASSGHTLPPPQVTALVYNDTRAFAHSLGGGSDKADWELLGDHLHSVSRRAGAFGSTFGLGCQRRRNNVPDGGAKLYQSG
jgi:hypothetical protein